MKSYLDHLSLENNDGIDKLGTQFLDVFLDEVEKCSNNKSNTCQFLGFVRLSIIAHRP
jgi:hypothetical protein